MTADRAAKQAIRDRAVRDGVPYSVARRAIVDELTPASALALTPPHGATDVGPVLDALCGSDTTLEQARETITLGMVAPTGDGPVVGIADVRLAARSETRTVWSAVPVVSARLTELTTDPRAETERGRSGAAHQNGMDAPATYVPRRETLEAYTDGDCWHLAYTIHRRTGWPMIFADPTDHLPAARYWEHAAVVVPGGRVLDIEGVHSRRVWKQRWGAKRVTVVASTSAIRALWIAGQERSFTTRSAGVASRLLRSTALEARSPHMGQA